MELVRVGRAMGLEVEVTEIDICRGPNQDVLHPAAWTMTFEQILAKKYASVFTSPPCNNF